MTRAKSTILAILAVLLVPAVANADNILTNPGFETGDLVPWVIGNDFGSIELWNVTSSDSNTGSNSATARGNHEIVQWFDPVAASDILEASMWLQMGDEGFGVAFISLYYSDGSSGGDVFNIGASWAQFDVTSLLNASKFLTGFGVYGCNGCAGESRTFMDDAVIDVVRVPEPSTLALLGLGLVGMGMTRRKKNA